MKKKREIFQGAQKLLKGINVKEIDYQKMSVEEQTEQLPYDERWEFPKYRLKLGSIISDPLVTLSDFERPNI